MKLEGIVRGASMKSGGKKGAKERKGEIKEIAEVKKNVNTNKSCPGAENRNIKLNSKEGNWSRFATL